MARRQPTPTNLIDRRSGEVHVFPSRSAARAYRAANGSANYRTSEYIQRIVRLETANPGISRTEARGHARAKIVQALKPSQYRRGRGAAIDPSVYGVTSGSPTRSIDLAGIKALRAQLDKTKSNLVKVSIRARWQGSSHGSGSPDVVPIEAGNPDPPQGTKYDRDHMWVGRTRHRGGVQRAIELLEQDAADQRYGPAVALNRFAWRMGLAPAIRVTDVTFQEMPE